MDYTPYWNWIQANYVLVGIIIVILFYVIYNWIKKRKVKKQEKPQEEKYPAPQQTPAPAFEEYDFERDFEASAHIEKNNLSYLRNERERLRREIQDRKTEYKRTKERHEKNLLIGKRLAKFIPELMEQERVIDQEIKRLEKNGR